jgi:hypothetical protein
MAANSVSGSSGAADRAVISRLLGPATRANVPIGVKVGLWLLLLLSLIAGLQQQFAPRSFYDAFPGFGLTWVSTDGPYNEHLLRDLGGANLAMAVMILFALVRPSAGLVRAVALAVLVAQVPHFLYHAAHLGLLPTLLDQVLQTISLTLVLIVAAYVLVRAGRIADMQPRSANPEPTIDDASPARPDRLIASTQ